MCPFPFPRVPFPTSTTSTYDFRSVRLFGEEKLVHNCSNYCRCLLSTAKRRVRANSINCRNVKKSASHKSFKNNFYFSSINKPFFHIFRCWNVHRLCVWERERWRSHGKFEYPSRWIMVDTELRHLKDCNLSLHLVSVRFKFCTLNITKQQLPFTHSHTHTRIRNIISIHSHRITMEICCYHFTVWPSLWSNDFLHFSQYSTRRLLLVNFSIPFHFSFLYFSILMHRN